ncbi:hypothetical protein ACIQUZ_34490 [Streptomyces griseus]|uniref:hypothetical protein n=1 Tax=Streptomyces griseus TaxID=1911 RepID=UPI0037F98A08
MRTSEIRTTAVPGVVDGSLTIRLGAGDEVSLHIGLGLAGGPFGGDAQFEILLGPQHAETVRAALEESSSTTVARLGALPPTVPCRIGIHVSR